jgi:hypothetical protein
MSQVPTKIYRRILAQAWNKTLRSRGLWVFGILASFATTGGIAETLLRGLNQVKSTQYFLLDLIQGSWPGAESFGVYILGLKELPQERLFLSVGALALFCLLFCAAVVASQSAVWFGLRERRPPHMQQALHGGFRYFWRMLGLDLILKIGIAILMLFTTLPILLVSLHPSWQYALVYLGVFFVFFPAIILFHMLATLAMADVVRTDNHLHGAWHEAWMVVKQHAVASVEFAVLLFLVVAAGSIATLLALFLVTAVLSAIATALTASAGLYTILLVKTLGSMFFLGALAVLFGIATIFQYAAWLGFYERAAGLHARFPMMAKLFRIFSK